QRRSRLGPPAPRSPPELDHLERLRVEDNPVVAPGRLEADVTVANVFAYPFRIALERVAEAAAAACAKLDDRAGSERVRGRLEHVPLVLQTGIDDHVRADRVAASEQAPGRSDRALEPEVEARLRLDLEGAI